MQGRVLHLSHPSEHPYACLQLRTGLQVSLLLFGKLHWSYSAVCRSRTCPHRSAPRRMGTRSPASHQDSCWRCFLSVTNLPVNYLMTVTISHTPLCKNSPKTFLLLKNARSPNSLFLLCLLITSTPPAQPALLPCRGHGGPMEEVQGGKCSAAILAGHKLCICLK